MPSYPHTHLKRVTGSSRGCIVWAQLILYNRPSSLGMGDSAHTPPSFTGNLTTMVLLWLWREAACRGRRRKGEVSDTQRKQNWGYHVFWDPGRNSSSEPMHHFFLHCYCIFCTHTIGLSYKRDVPPLSVHHHHCIYKKTPMCLCYIYTCKLVHCKPHGNLCLHEIRVEP